MKKSVILTIASSVIIAALVLTSCSPKASEDIETTKPTEIAQSEKVEIIQNNAEEFEGNMEGEYLLLDVRTQEEYDADHIEGSTLIPVDELDSRLSEIADYKDQTVLVYCRSGNRSMVAADVLVKNGFTKVHNLQGGIGAWNSYKGN